MNSILPLQTFYQRNWKNLDVVTPLDGLVYAQGDQTHSCSSIEQLLTASPYFNVHSAWNQLEVWRETLTLLLVACMNDCLELYQESLKIKITDLMKNSYWEEFQLEAILRTLCSYFLNLPVKTMAPYQLPSGAAPLESGKHWPWAEGPHSIFQAELGILWFVLGTLKNDPDFLTASKKAAEWQLNTLDYYFSPFKGLYVQENDASSTLLLVYNYLLFHSVGMDGIANNMLAELKALEEKISINIPAYAVMLEAWIERHSQKKNKLTQEEELSANICDLQNALVGYRSPEFSLAFTLTGGGTGMGAIHQRDVQLISYGPQHLPLGDCRGFGIETYRCSQSEVFSEKDHLQLKSLAKLASKPSPIEDKALFRFGKPSGTWMEARQSFMKNQLSIEVTFFGIRSLEEVAFTFFACAATCLVEQSRVNPRSIDRYQGKSLPIDLEGTGRRLTIWSSTPVKEMHIIPLAGGDSFWGADFLVAYILNPTQLEYSWHVEMKN